jgi:hypothetical protein
MSTNDEAKSYKEAMSSNEKKLWSQDMHEEMYSLDHCDMWDLASFTKGRKAIGCKWIFKNKIGADGNLKRYKARLLDKGYSQREGVEFNEIFSHVAKLTSIGFLLSISSTSNFEIEKMDVKTAFLHQDLDEEIYMRQPNGFVVKGKEELVCKLKRSLYGLKKSPRMWYQNFDAFALKIGYVRSEEDHYVYIKLIDDQILIIILYVDDMLFIGNNKVMIKELKAQLSNIFEMKYLGAAKYIFGMEINRDRCNINLFLSHSNYVDTILKWFNMHDSKPINIPLLVGMKLILDMSPKSDFDHEEMF